VHRSPVSVNTAHILSKSKTFFGFSVRIFLLGKTMGAMGGAMGAGRGII
jgi:hypothetical protein